jgi:hypothetical protein
VELDDDRATDCVGGPCEGVEFLRTEIIDERAAARRSPAARVAVGREPQHERAVGRQPECGAERFAGRARPVRSDQHIAPGEGGEEDVADVAPEGSRDDVPVELGRREVQRTEGGVGVRRGAVERPDHLDRRAVPERHDVAAVRPAHRGVDAVGVERPPAREEPGVAAQGPPPQHPEGRSSRRATPGPEVLGDPVHRCAGTDQPDVVERRPGLHGVPEEVVRVAAVVRVAHPAHLLVAWPHRMLRGGVEDLERRQTGTASCTHSASLRTQRPCPH